ncbi:MAG: hypothetical protein JWP01_3385 [Myxococcales bacterium]|nr:hypothetical protein [Myxococcales bacterium]
MGELLLDGDGWAIAAIASVAHGLTERQLRRRVRSGAIRSRMTANQVEVFALPANEEAL